MKNNTVTKLITKPILFALFCILALNVFTSVTLCVRLPITQKVSTIADLKTAIANSVPGDIIILADGTYLNTTLDIGTLNIDSNITVKTATPGGVFLNGTTDINLKGNYITFSGFQFTTGNIGTNYLIEVYGSHNLLTQLNFSGYFAKKYIEVKADSQYNEITYCNIEKKPALAEFGCTIQISTSPTVIGYHKISYCSFQNYYGGGGDNGNEPVRIGLGAEYLNKSRTVVEHCYFNNTGDGDSESISVKCQENVIRFCTFTNQQNAMLCFRNGDNNVAYSNFFISAGGIRVKEANNIFCYNNYFYDSGTATNPTNPTNPTNLANPNNAADAVTYVYVSPLAPTTLVPPRTSNLVNINFIHNTFYNCGNIDLGKTGATSNTWLNNVFKKSSGSIFKNANAGTTWLGNIYQGGTIGITIAPASGMTSKNLYLATNSEGYYGLSSISPIDNANASYPVILDITDIDDDPSLLLDISGQARVGIKDVGCDEFTTGTTTNHPLKISEVGPSYLGGPSLSINTNEFLDKTRITIFPNPTMTSFSIDTPSKAGLLLHVAVYNSNGQLVKKYDDFQKEALERQTNQYDVSDLNNGIYFVKVISENTSKTMKIIIKK